MVRLIYTFIAGTFLLAAAGVIKALTTPALGGLLALVFLMLGAYIAVKIDERRKASR